MFARRPIAHLFFLTSLLFPGGCSAAQKPAPPALADVPQESLDSSLRLTVPPSLDTFDFNSHATLKLENLSDNPIHFENDYGAEIYLFREWIQIASLSSYLGGDKVLYPTKDSPSNIGVVSYYPDLSSYTLPITLRFVVLGEIDKVGDSTEEPVGAFFDLTLRPYLPALKSQTNHTDYSARLVSACGAGPLQGAHMCT